MDILVIFRKKFSSSGPQKNTGPGWAAQYFLKEDGQFSFEVHLQDELSG